MTLDDIRRGSHCVLDTNVLLYAEHGISEQARRFLRRCVAGEVTVTMPEVVWLEITHKLMVAEAIAREPRGTWRNPGARLAKSPELVRSLSVYRAKVLALHRLGLGFEACTPSDLLESGFALQERYGLLTNDAMVLAVALRLRADVLVSGDTGFHGVTEIAVARPTDLSR